VHSAVASPYAHCTAPLRRLADRYVSETCLALRAAEPVPDWVRAALPGLPKEMDSADRRAHEIERAVVDLAEAVVLAPRVGQTFEAVVVEAGPRGGAVQLPDPAVRARCEGTDLPLGKRISVRLEVANPETRTVSFRPV
jgi:exoribonuclease R